MREGDGGGQEDGEVLRARWGRRGEEKKRNQWKMSSASKLESSQR